MGTQGLTTPPDLATATLSGGCPIYAPATLSGSCPIYAPSWFDGVWGVLRIWEILGSDHRQHDGCLDRFIRTDSLAKT